MIFVIVETTLEVDLNPIWFSNMEISIAMNFGGRLHGFVIQTSLCAIFNVANLVSPINLPNNGQSKKMGHPSTLLVSENPAKQSVQGW